MSNRPACRICGGQLPDDNASTTICAKCLYGELIAIDQQNQSPAGFPRDFESFQKQTDQIPGAFSDAVLEKVRSESSMPVPEPPEPDRLWSWQSGVLVWLFSVAAILFFPLIFYVGGIMYLSTHGHPVDEKALSKSPGLAILLLSSNIPAHLITLLVAWAVVTRLGKRPFLETLGWKWHPLFRPWQALALVMIMLAIFIPADTLIPHPHTDFDDLVAMVTAKLLGQIILVVLVVFSAPIVEEVVYRGVLFTSLEKKFGTTWGIVIVASLFAGVHVPQYLAFVFNNS